MLDCKESAEEGRKDDEEDTGPGILTGVVGCPLGGVESCRIGGEEDHLHV